MTFVFKNIVGIKDSKQENFEGLCSRLIINLFPDAKPVEGKWGDEGVDSFVGLFNGECRVYQCKYFIEKVGTSQRRQIEDSLKKAISHHNLQSWTLMVPKNLTPSEIKWFQKLQEKYNPLEMDWWGETKLQNLLANHPALIREFQPKQSTMNIILNANLNLNESDKNDIVKVLANALKLKKDNQISKSNLAGMAASILNKSKLKVLIFGPGNTGDELYKKRCEIKEKLISLGHEALFPEEILNEDVLKSGLNLTTYELLMASDSDYIVCLMTSPGSIAEALDFGKKKEIAGKMMICIDQSHSQGYIANGFIPIFQGLNGNIFWFEDPNDLTECHLATKVLSQIDNVYQVKQWELSQRGLS